MKTEQNNQLITTLVTRMIFQIAPREMQLFQGQKEEYLRDPQQIINKRGYSGKKNGQEKIIFLAPIVRNILTEVVAQFEQELADMARNGESGQLIFISPMQARQIYDFAYGKACHYQLSAIKAHLVADAVIDSLTSARPAI
ncbi:MAG: hypothetical protein R6X34_25720 [Chloroflexota bacterium]|jgi:hypothetical protein